MQKTHLPQSQTTDQHIASRGRDTGQYQSGKSGTIREANQVTGVRKAHYYVRKNSILLAGTGLRKISSVAC